MKSKHCITTLLIIVIFFSTLTLETVKANSFPLDAVFETASPIPESTPDITAFPEPTPDVTASPEPTSDVTAAPVSPTPESTLQPFSTSWSDDDVKKLFSKLDLLITYCQIFGHIAKLICGIVWGICICLLIFYMLSRFY